MYYIAADQKNIKAEDATVRKKMADILNLKITKFMFYLKK
jgi:hypothetical protein